MATPLLATHRVDVPYIVPGLPEHHMRILCNAVPDGSFTDGWALVDRTGAHIDFADAMSYLMPLFVPLFANDSTIGDPQLQQFVAGAYPTVATGTGGGTGTSTIPGLFAQQTSITFHSTTLLENLRIQVMEASHAYVDYYGKFLTEASIPATVLRNFVGGFTDTAGAHAMYKWTRNRGASFIQALLSTVFDQNERLKRERGAS